MQGLATEAGGDGFNLLLVCLIGICSCSLKKLVFNQVSVYSLVHLSSYSRAVGMEKRHLRSKVKPDIDLVLMHSPVAASVGTVISQTLITSTITSRAPLLPICVYRSLILGQRKRSVTMSRLFITAVVSFQVNVLTF